MITKRFIVLKANVLVMAVFAFLTGNCFGQNITPVLPTSEQVAWANSEIGVIIHLDINIFAPNTFDYKKKSTLPDVDVFNPSRLNTDQWIKTAKSAGAKYAILTVKHGTGFGLWPSKANSYNVGHTKWRNGKADILKDFLASCKKYGLKPGLYYNTNVNTYYNAGYEPFRSDDERAAFNRVVLQQLTELWSNYGKMFEIWFDGGIKADKEGGIESRVLKLIKEKQPQAILFGGPVKLKNVIRWVGNEDGIAAYPQWSKANATIDGKGVQTVDNLHGAPNGKYWCPAESDFPIRKSNAWNGGWLWKAGEESYLFTVKELINKYEKSVGRNTNMLIGMVVDTTGLIPQKDALVFDSLGKKIQQLYQRPIVKINNSNKKTILLESASTHSISRVMIEEDMTQGENIRNYVVQAYTASGWREVARGESVGHKRIQVFNPINTRKLKFEVTKAAGAVALKQVAFY